MSRTGELDTDLDQLLWELKLLQPTEMRSGSLPTSPDHTGWSTGEGLPLSPDCFADIDQADLDFLASRVDMTSDDILAMFYGVNRWFESSPELHSKSVERKARVQEILQGSIHSAVIFILCKKCFSQKYATSVHYESIRSGQEQIKSAEAEVVSHLDGLIALGNARLSRRTKYGDSFKIEAGISILSMKSGSLGELLGSLEKNEFSDAIERNYGYRVGLGNLSLLDLLECCSVGIKAIAARRLSELDSEASAARCMFSGKSGQNKRSINQHILINTLQDYIEERWQKRGAVRPTQQLLSRWDIFVSDSAMRTARSRKK